MKDLKELILNMDLEEMDIGDLIIYIPNNEAYYTTNIPDSSTSAATVAALLRVLADISILFSDFQTIEDLEDIVDMYSQLTMNFIMEQLSEMVEEIEQEDKISSMS